MSENEAEHKKTATEVLTKADLWNKNMFVPNMWRFQLSVSLNSETNSQKNGQISQIKLVIQELKTV